MNHAVEAVMEQFVLTWKLLLDRRVPLHAKLIFAIPLLYLISPIDFIPDFIIGLGQLDDIGLIIAGIKALELLSPPDVVAGHRADIRQRRQGAPDVVEAPGFRRVERAEKRKNH